jgi:predicted Kef-type K+ transport protein
MAGVEDLLMVLTLVLSRSYGVLGGDVPDNGGNLWAALGVTIGKVCV